MYLNRLRKTLFVASLITVAALCCRDTAMAQGNTLVVTPTNLSFRTYSEMSTTGLFSLTADMYDWTISAFSSTAVSTGNIGNTFRSIGVGADAPVARFLDANRKIRARYRIKQVGPAGSAQWCNSIDQAVWFVR